MPDPLSIADRVLLVLENLVLSGLEITETSTWTDMGLDSLDKIELLMDLEDEFNIVIPDDVMVYLEDFGETIQYIERQLKDV